MAPLTISIREGHLIVAKPAVFSLEDFGHSIFGGALFDIKNVRVTELAPVPDSVLLMGKNYVGHALHL